MDVQQCETHLWRLRQVVNPDPTPGDPCPNTLYVHCPLCGAVQLIGAGTIIVGGGDNE